VKTSQIRDVHQDHGEHLNAILAAGALNVAIEMSSIDCSAEALVDETGVVTGDLLVRIPFLSSPYRLTLTRVEEISPDCGTCGDTGIVAEPPHGHKSDCPSCDGGRR
jgi:hypothetical protein